MNKHEEEFLFNTVLLPHQYCGRTSHIQELENLVHKKNKIVVYAPRRYGKTSLCQNIIKEKFVNKHPHALPIYCDFMDVDSLEDINERLGDAIAHAINHYLPLKSKANSILSLLKNASFSINSSIFTGEMGLQFVPGKNEKLKLEKNLELLVTLSSKYSVLLIFDEFQDLYYVKTALAKIRSHLQQLQKTPMIMLGSKKRLLSKIFSSNHSPFFNFAVEYSLPPVEVVDWVPYFNKRLKSKSLSISTATMRELSNLCYHVPNTICEVGFVIKENFKDKEITISDIKETVLFIINQKQQSFRFQLSSLSVNEKNFLRVMAEEAYIPSFLNKDFVSSLRLSASGANKIGERLFKIGIVEEEADLGFRISNPLLRYFLMSYH